MLRLFRHGGGAKSIYSVWRRHPFCDSFKSSRSSSRNRLLGTKLSCRTKPDSVEWGWCSEKPWCCIDCCDHRKQQSTYTSQHLFNNNSGTSHTPQRRKSEATAYACMHPCMHAHVQINTRVRTFTDAVRVQSLYVVIYRRISTKGGQTHTERKNSARMASLIRSKLAKISRKLDRVEKNRWYLDLFEPKSGTMSNWPIIEDLLGCVLYLFLEFNWFWPKSG